MSDDMFASSAASMLVRAKLVSNKLVEAVLKKDCMKELLDEGMGLSASEFEACGGKRGRLSAPGKILFRHIVALEAELMGMFRQSEGIKPSSVVSARKTLESLGKNGQEDIQQLTDAVKLIASEFEKDEVSVSMDGGETVESSPGQSGLPLKRKRNPIDGEVAKQAKLADDDSSEDEDDDDYAASKKSEDIDSADSEGDGEEGSDDSDSDEEDEEEEEEDEEDEEEEEEEDGED